MWPMDAGHGRAGFRSGLRPQLLKAFKRGLVPFGLRLGTFKAYPPRALTMPPPVDVGDLESLPSVSIVTPSFNQARYLDQAIRSVRAQGHPRLEHVIQDGGSSDGSIDVIRAFEGHLAAWASEPDSGQAEAINRGFARTSGEIMAWLNADDVLLPGAVLAAAAHFRDHPETDVVYGHRLVIDEDGREVGRWVLPRHRRGALIWRDYVPQETMFWRRSLWEQTGGHVDDSYQFAMDWELVIRFDRFGARFVRLPRFLACFRTHEHQKSLALREAVGEAEFDRLRAVTAPGGFRRRVARAASAAYLAESIGWTWAHKLRLAGP